MKKKNTAYTLFQTLKKSNSRRTKLKIKSAIINTKTQKEAVIENRVSDKYLKTGRQLLRIYLSQRKKKTTLPSNNFEQHPSFKHFVWLAQDIEKHQKETGLTGFCLRRFA